MSVQLTPQQKLLAGRLFATRRMPYFTSAIYMLIPREASFPKGEDGRGSGMAVTDRGYLLWDPVEIGHRTVEQVGTTLLHEVSHWIRGHHARGKIVGAYPEKPYDQLTEEDHRRAEEWNWAGDCEINDDLQAVQTLSPMPGWFYPKTVQAPDGLTAEEYLTFIRKLPKRPKGKGGSGDGCGQCGSAGGHAVGGEPQDGPGRTPREVAAMKRQVAEAVRQAASKNRGTVPAGLQRWANALFEPPKVPWQQKLAKAIRSAVAYRAGMVDYRYERPSRRQSALDALGQGIVLPAMRAPVPEVTVAVDTSGSMGCGEGSPLEEAVRESIGVLKAVGAPINFLTCDAEVHTQRRVRTAAEVLRSLRGGGGTSFLPVFRALPTIRPRPSILVFATDGYGDWEQCRQPAGTQVIWVVPGDNKEDAPFGETIHVD